MDSAGKFNGVQGYMKLSVTALGPGDAAPAHNEEEVHKLVFATKS